MSLWLLLIVLSFATFRLTRLVTRDDFPPIFWARTRIQRARPLIVKKPASGEAYQDFWWLGELVSCPWCASAYISAGLVVTTWLWRGLPLPLFCWLAVWGAGAALAHWTDR